MNQLFKKVGQWALAAVMVFSISTVYAPKIHAAEAESTVQTQFQGGSLFQYGKTSKKASNPVKLKNDSGLDAHQGSGANRVVYLQFENPNPGMPVAGAEMELWFKNQDPYDVVVKVYAVKNDDWMSQGLTWEQGPALDKNGLTKVDTQAVQAGEAMYLGDIVVKGDTYSAMQKYDLSIPQSVLFDTDESKISILLCPETKQAGNFYLSVATTKEVPTLRLVKGVIAPTDLAISNNVISENAAAGSVVGVFSTTSFEENDTFTYSLVSGEGDTDNTFFTVQGDTLCVGPDAKFDAEVKNEYSVRVRTTSSNGQYFEKVMKIMIVGVSNEASLHMLSVDGQELDLAQGSEHTVYVAADKTSVNVTAQPLSNMASVVVNGQTPDANHTVSLPVQNGNNKVEITVTAEDKTTVKTYVVNVVVSKEAVAEGFVLVNGETKTPFVYDEQTQTWTAKVAHEVNTVSIVPVVNSLRPYTMSVKDMVLLGVNTQYPVTENVQAGYTKNPLSDTPLLVGENPMEWTLVDEKGTAHVYHVNIEREGRTQPKEISVATTQQLRDALVCAVPGDTIVLTAPLYEIHSETLLLHTFADGEQGKYITIRGAGDGATIRRESYRKGPMFVIYNDYYRFENITLDANANASNGLQIHGASHGEVKKVVVKNSTTEAFKIKNSSQYWYFEECTAMDTGVKSKGPDNNHSGGIYAEGFYCGDAQANWFGGDVDRTGYITFNRCQAIRTINDGWDCKEGTHDIKIINCLVDFQGIQVEQSMGNSGVFSRANNLQIINTIVRNNEQKTNNGGELVHANGNRSYKGEEFGVGLEVFGCTAQNLYDAFYVMSFPEGKEANFTIYDNNKTIDLPTFNSTRSSHSAAQAAASTFKQLTWNGEGGAVIELLDTTQLQKLVEKAQSMQVGADVSEQDAAAFRNALKDAEMILQNPYSFTQEKVENAFAALQAAIERVENSGKPVVTPTPAPTAAPSATPAPTAAPTAAPSAKPTDAPAPTAAPVQTSPINNTGIDISTLLMGVIGVAAIAVVGGIVLAKKAKNASKDSK